MIKQRQKSHQQKPKTTALGQGQDQTNPEKDNGWENGGARARATLVAGGAGGTILDCGGLVARLNVRTRKTAFRYPKGPLSRQSPPPPPGGVT